MKSLSVLLVLLSFGFLCGCSSSSSSNSGPTLMSIQVSPASPSVAAGLTQAFTAKGTYSDSSTQDLTSKVTWSSSTTSVATIDATGTATTKTAGTTTISATFSGVTGTTTLQVTPPTLVSIAVTPSNPALSPGMFQQFTATGTYTDGSTQDLTNTATWTSSTQTVATISATGYLTARTLGTTTIQATSGSVSGSIQLTVGAPTLTSIQIPSGNLTIALGTSYPLVAMGVYSDGGQRNATGNVTWSCSDTTIGNVSAVGQVTGLKAGTATITATSGSVTQSITLTVTTATLKSLAVAPSSRTIEPFTKQPYDAVGVLSDNSVQDLRPYVLWASSDQTVATINNVPQIGLATAVAGGNTNISATSGPVSAMVPLTVSTATLTGMTLSPSSTNIAIGSVEVLRVLAQYSDGSSIPVNTSVTWSSSDSTIASIDALGTITGVAAGTATITAQMPNTSVSATSTLTVEPVQSIAITPASLSVAPGTYLRFTATGTLNSGKTQDLTSSVTWTSSAPSVAVISNVPGTFGGAIGLTPGTSTIGAVLDGQVGSAQVTVTTATLQSITLTPSNPSIAVSSFQAFKAVGNFSDGTTEVLTSQVKWTSSDVSVAVVDLNGNALPSGTGTTKITATLGGVSANTNLTTH